MKMPIVLTSKQELREWRSSIQTDSLGFVPTMGALHQGHLSLLQKSQNQNSKTLLSIFVNPTQFGKNEDFHRYPKTLQKDIELSASVGVDAIFAPSIEEMYQEGDPITLNPPEKMGYVYEGFHRQGHFNGVLQVVLKLFLLTQAQRAYFGQKDAQQLLLIQKMVRDFFIPIEIVPCPTVRDTDGLALSSRNVYLSTEERHNALQIPQTLQWIKHQIQSGEKEVALLKKEALAQLNEVGVEYLAFCNYDLEEIETILPSQTLILLTAKVGNTRLLDNLWI